MDLTLTADEIDFAIYMYMAIKGYDTSRRQYTTNIREGLVGVTCHGVKKINPNIDKIVLGIQER